VRLLSSIVHSSLPLPLPCFVSSKKDFSQIHPHYLVPILFSASNTLQPHSSLSYTLRNKTGQDTVFSVSTLNHPFFITFYIYIRHHDYRISQTDGGYTHQVSLPYTHAYVSATITHKKIGERIYSFQKRMPDQKPKCLLPTTLIPDTLF
jgi:hypothetical protein